MTVQDFIEYEAQAGMSDGSKALPLEEVAYLEGILSGFAWANYQLMMRKDRPLYCVPGYLVVSADMAVPMIRAYIHSHFTETAAVTSSVPLVMVLIDSMKEAFPCKAASAKAEGE